MSSSQSDDPVAFYFLASWLNLHRQDPLVPEVSRVIVGRAYYAAFLAARDAANRTGARIHNDVIAYYHGSKNTYVGNKLADLKRLREQADYELNKPISIPNIDASLKGCKAILSKLQLLNSTSYQLTEYSPLSSE